MHTEKINPIQSASLQSSLNKDRKFTENFQDIFHRALNGKSNSWPSKIELSGLLIPCHLEFQDRLYKYKLGTESNEYLLSISSQLSRIAKNAEWEEVSVKGYFDPSSDVFEVEKITLTEVKELPTPALFQEISFELEDYEKIISQRGKLEPIVDDLAS